MKRSKLPFMPMGVMTGRYFRVGRRNIHGVAKTLRQKFKDMKFSVVKGMVPGILPDKIRVEYKDRGKEVDQKRAEEVERFINNLKEED